MKTILEVWNNLPVAKQRQLSSLHGVKIHGITEEQLVWELENKLPQGLLEVKEQPGNEPDVMKDDTFSQEAVEEAKDKLKEIIDSNKKEVKPKKKKKAKK